MLEFPRWKYVLVTLVVLIGLLFALPNLFGEDPALQVERKSRAPMDNFARQSIEDLLHKQNVVIKRDFIDSGRLILAFNDVASQLKARDTVDATLSDVDRSALANASRAPAWMRDLGLKAMPLGLDLRGGLFLLYQVDVNGAVSQLLENACKFTRHRTEISLSVYAAADRILIDIQDSCGGLPPGAAQSMFIPFTQSHADRSGLGLGLSISKRSVEANDGILSVRDIPGSGCVFTIDLPRHSLPNDA